MSAPRSRSTRSTDLVDPVAHALRLMHQAVQTLESWQAVRGALSDDPQPVRAVAAASGVSKSAVDRYLRSLEALGGAHRTRAGWVAGGGERAPETKGARRQPRGGSEPRMSVAAHLSSALQAPRCRCARPVADDEGDCSRCGKLLPEAG